ncbi:MAG: CocE/NonD family hydrolase [Fuerstiella sp.]
MNGSTVGLHRRKFSNGFTASLPWTLCALLFLPLLTAEVHGADPSPRAFRVWATSCSHVPADIRRGRESLATAIRQSEGQVAGVPAFDWDIMIDAGDLSAHQTPPGDKDGRELLRQYRAMTKHRREQIYNVPGNHDAPYYDHIPGSWFQKWGDPLGESTLFSGVEAGRRPFPVEGTWERYRFLAGNILFLMLADRNDAPEPVGRGHSKDAKKGGYPAGAVTRETFNWWKQQVLGNQGRIIVTMHHHALRDTTIASGFGEGNPRYHGSSGGPVGSSYLYYLIENDDPQDFQYLKDAHVFEDFLDDFHKEHGRGAIDLWVAGHTHARGPDDNWGDKTISESRWGVGFLQVAALTRHHGGSHPLSRLLTFTDGSKKVATDVYLHDASFKKNSVGWYGPASESFPLRHEFVAPPPIRQLSPFPKTAIVFDEPYPTAKQVEPKPARRPIKVITTLDVPVEMRDGVILRANVFRPDKDGSYPVLVLRTPYGKPGAGMDRYVKAGYIVVTQDARGRYASEGQWESFLRFKTHDAEDGYDTVEWAAHKLSGSNGRIGTFGASYNAFLQWRLAALRPPSLVAMAASSIPARYTDLEGPGTIRPGRRMHWWVTSMAPNMRLRSGRPGITKKAEMKKLWSAGESTRWLNHLPWLQLPESACEDETEAVRYWLKNPHTDPWDLHTDVKDIQVPNLNFIGWCDHCNGNMLLDRTIMSEAATPMARSGSRTIVGPWAHSKNRRYGNIDFGPEATVDVTELQIQWFDYWLKKKQNGMDKTSAWKIFVMGDNSWRNEKEWPLQRTEKKSLFISSNGAANMPAGDGRLLWGQPAEAGTDQFTYDPNDPVPSLHGPGLQVRPTDQRAIADRTDILVYQTEPLTERFEVTGNVTVELYASSSAPDTDFFARLIDVAPDGMARDVALGMVRARYRTGLGQPTVLQPGETVRYTIEMDPTSNAFLPGHRIRLDITSSDFPNYDRNHNTAADQNSDSELQIAQQTIHHGGVHATRIKMPWVPNAAK